MPELWAQAVAEIKERIGRQNYETWIKPIGFISRNKNEICLDVPNKFFRDWLTEHYLAQIQDILSTLAKHDVKVVFEINEKTNRQANAEKGVKREERERVQKSNSNRF